MAQPAEVELGAQPTSPESDRSPRGWARLGEKEATPGGARRWRQRVLELIAEKARLADAPFDFVLVLPSAKLMLDVETRANFAVFRENSARRGSLVGSKEYLRRRGKLIAGIVHAGLVLDKMQSIAGHELYIRIGMPKQLLKHTLEAGKFHVPVGRHVLYRCDSCDREDCGPTRYVCTKKVSASSAHLRSNSTGRRESVLEQVQRQLVATSSDVDTFGPNAERRHSGSKVFTEMLQTLNGNESAARVVRYDVCKECFRAGNLPRDTSPYEYQVRGDAVRTPDWNFEAYHSALGEDPSVTMLDEERMMNSSLRLKALHARLTMPVNKGGAGLNLDRLITQRLVKRVVCMHDENEKEALRSSWAHNFLQLPWEQPLEKIKDYLGENVALYFAWAGFLTTWQLWLSIIGFLVFVLKNVQILAGSGEDGSDGSGGTDQCPAADKQPFRDSRHATPVLVAFTMVTVVWAALYLEFWKRRLNELIFKWGMRTYSDRELPRADFHGMEREVRLEDLQFDLPISLGSDGLEQHFPAGRRRLYQLLVTFPVMLLMIGLQTSVMFGILHFRVKLMEDGFVVDKGMSSNVASVIAGLLNALFVVGFSVVYSPIAKNLTGLENWRTETEAEDSLVFKVVIFEAINNFSSLIYIAFFAGCEVLTGKACVPPGCEDSGSVDAEACAACHDFELRELRMAALEVQLGATLCFKIFAQNMAEFITPWFDNAWREFKQTRSLKLSRNMLSMTLNPVAVPSSNVERQAHQPEFAGVSQEYQELVLQFGYVVLFASAFPLGPLFCLLNNLVEIKIDAHKILVTNSRPLPRGANSIGSWGEVMTAMTYLCTVTNSALLAFASNAIETLGVRTFEERLIFFICAENALLLLRMLLASPHLIKEESKPLRLAAAKLEQLQENQGSAKPPKDISKTAATADNLWQVALQFAEAQTHDPALAALLSSSNDDEGDGVLLKRVPTKDLTRLRTSFIDSNRVSVSNNDEVMAGNPLFNRDAERTAMDDEFEKLLRDGFLGLGENGGVERA